MRNAEIYLQKAIESLRGAESEKANRRFNNCANRCYYACFQAAIAALILAGHSTPPSGRWSHASVQAAFSGQLVTRLKRYPAEMRDTLIRNMELRHIADYHTDPISEISAVRAVRRANHFVDMVTKQSEQRR
jgi:uncharacterized protein (UPF0332 family)